MMINGFWPHDPTHGSLNLVNPNETNCCKKCPYWPMEKMAVTCESGNS
jgi:hypothetical protein